MERQIQSWERRLDFFVRKSQLAERRTAAVAVVVAVAAAASVPGMYGTDVYCERCTRCLVSSRFRSWMPPTKL
jgi:cytochrome c5